MNRTSHSRRRPKRGPIPYVGGKSNLADAILACFPEHVTYVEPFAGGAQVLFRKPPSRAEIINDLDEELTTFFRVVQNHPEELVRYAGGWLASRTWFEILCATNPKSLTDVQRATRFLYLQKLAYGGRVRTPQFNCRPQTASSFNHRTLADMIESASARLRSVQIECLPYEQILKRFDGPTTLFYLDPPYLGKPFYHHNFNLDDFARLANNLRKLIGKFLLSSSDSSDVRNLFSGFHIQEVNVRYPISGAAGRLGTELLISNFRPQTAGQ